MITSTSNQKIRELKELLGKARARRKTGCFVAEGARMVCETPGDKIQELYVSESFMKSVSETGSFPLDLSSAQLVEDRVFKSVSDTMTPQGIMAVVKQSDYRLEDILAKDRPMLLFLENIQDPGNLGTMIRTAEGAGAAGLVMSRDTVDIYNPKVVRSTMGSLYRMPFVYVDDLPEAVRLAQKSGITAYAAYLSGSVNYTKPDYRKGTAFLIGNEGNGLTRKAAMSADARIHIPMAGSLESLNAAVAAAVLMYEASRQRM